jgi:hypothetical protein
MTVVLSQTAALGFWPAARFIYPYNDRDANVSAAEPLETRYSKITKLRELQVQR